MALTITSIGVAVLTSIVAFTVHFQRRAELAGGLLADLRTAILLTAVFCDLALMFILCGWWCTVATVAIFTLAVGLRLVRTASKPVEKLLGGFVLGCVLVGLLLAGQTSTHADSTTRYHMTVDHGTARARY